MTSGSLNETDPALSPDGNRLAFAMRPHPSDNGPADIYITDGPGHTPQRVTDNASDDRYPAWSADATMLAFARINGATCDGMGRALAGRRESRIPSCGNTPAAGRRWATG